MFETAVSGSRAGDDQAESAVEFSELPQVAVAGVPDPGAQVGLKPPEAGPDLRLIEEAEG
jgi:hypothetical protein